MFIPFIYQSYVLYLYYNCDKNPYNKKYKQ